jgi:hypothetical protein
MVTEMRPAHRAARAGRGAERRQDWFGLGPAVSPGSESRFAIRPRAGIGRCSAWRTPGAARRRRRRPTSRPPARCRPARRRASPRVWTLSARAVAGPPAALKAARRGAINSAAKAHVSLSKSRRRHRMAATHGARRSRQRAARVDASQIAVSGQFARPRGGGIDLSFVRVADDRPLVEDAAFPWLARDTPFGRNCYIFAEGEFLQQRAQ